MRIFAPGFLLGVCFIYFLTAVPSLLWTIPLLCFIGIVCCLSQFRFKFIYGFCFGLLWLLIYLNVCLSSPLPSNYKDKKMIISGSIVGLPKRTKKYDSFLLKEQGRLIKLNWYFNYNKIVPGDHWQLFVKLKRPNELKKIKGFDYQKWLFQQEIVATGYVLRSNINKKLSAGSFDQLSNRWRYDLLEKLNDAIYQYPMKKFIKALTLGSREDLKQSDWQILQRTGTSHLVAISGLHIGLVAGLVFFVISFLCRRVPWVLMRIPAQSMAAIFSLLAALLYCALAGFSLPTQRALIMLSVVLLAVVFKRRVIPWHAFCLALFLVVFFHPLSVLSMSFWLSFSAVGVIVYSINGRLKALKKIQQSVKIQFAVTIGLMPISILFFQKTSLIAPIANFVAIPWVGFIVVPLSLLGTLFLSINATCAHWLLIAAIWNMRAVWDYLQYLASFKFAGVNFAFSNAALFFSCLLAVLLLLAPRDFPAKYLSLFLFLPVIFLPTHFAGSSFVHIWAV